MEIILHIALNDIHILTLQLKVFTSHQENYTSQCIEINIFGIHSTKRIASYINVNYTAHCIEGYSYINITTKSFYFPSRKLYITVYEINIFGIHSTKRLASYINGNYTAHCIEGYSYIKITTKSFYFPSRKFYITVHRNKYFLYTLR